MKKKLLTLLLGITLVFTATACGGSGDGGESTANSESTASENAQKDGVYFEDGTLEIEDATIKILESTVLDPDTEMGETQPKLVITYEYTNKSEEKTMPTVAWSACFEADQETADATLEVGISPWGDKWQDLSDNSVAEVKPGKTVKCIIAYDLADKETPVVLTATQGILGDELGTHTINLK